MPDKKKKNIPKYNMGDFVIWKSDPKVYKRNSLSIGVIIDINHNINATYSYTVKWIYISTTNFVCLPYTSICSSDNLQHYEPNAIPIPK